MRRALITTGLLLFIIGVNGVESAQTEVVQTSRKQEQVKMLGLVRTICTFEEQDLGQYGSYSSWPDLLKHNPSEFNGWLARLFPTETSRRENPLHFVAALEVLPGWKLRLSLGADAHSYSVLLEDMRDRQGFAYFSDERGIIREGRYIR